MKRQNVSRIVIGTCNWSDFKGWYPAGTRTADRLAYYARHFSVVEVDSTFYGIMPPRNFETWAAATPDDFQFDVKAYRTMTRHGASYVPGRQYDDHDPDLGPSEEDFMLFKESLEPLRQADKLRAVQFQFPPWFSNTPQNLDHIEACRLRMDGYLMAVEFRHRSWLEPQAAEQTLSFLRDRGIVYTIADEPQVGTGTVPPVVETTSPALAVLRFHGRNAEKWRLSGGSGRDRYDYMYSSEELSAWATTIAALAERVQEVHVLMNNNVQSQGLVNAKQLQKLLGQPVTEDIVEPTVQTEMRFG